MDSCSPAKKMSRTREKNGSQLLGNPFFPPLRPASARPGHGRQAAPIFFPRRGLAKGCPWACLSFGQNTPFSIGFIRFSAIFDPRWNPLLSRIPCFPKCFKGFWVFLWRPESQHFPEYLVFPTFSWCFADFGWAARAGPDPGFGSIWGTRFFSPLRPG